MALLGEDEIRERLEGGDWRPAGGAIEREWRLPDFAAAIDFVERVAEVAEEAGHHPDILVHGWNKVRLTLSTHSEGGVTGADLDLAQRLDKIG